VSDGVLPVVLARLQRFAPEGVTLNADTDLVETLGLDSTSVVELVLDLEDELDLAIPLDALGDVRTAGELAAVAEARMDGDG